MVHRGYSHSGYGSSGYGHSNHGYRGFGHRGVLFPIMVELADDFSGQN